MPIDPHYTPSWLADELVSLLPDSPTSVVDIAAGGGALLDAVERRFGCRTLVGAVDLDDLAVRELSHRRQRWTVSRANSLLARSYRLSAAFRQVPSGYDAVVLNPPFSYRGGTRTDVTYRGCSYRVSPATAFVSAATAWARAAATISMILPTSVFSIRDDGSLWSAWRRDFEIEVVRELDRNTFPGCRMKTVLVRMQLSTPGSHLRSDEQVAERKLREPFWTGGCNCVEVIRGRVPVHRVKRYGLGGPSWPFVHTTQLQSEVVDSGLVAPHHLASEGHLVLVPRVGRPSQAKVVVHKGSPIVLSDCVIALRPIDSGRLSDLQKLVLDDMDGFAGLYTGSCAPYLTIDALMAWLNRGGIDPVRVPASSPVGHCWSLLCRSGSDYPHLKEA